MRCAVTLLNYSVKNTSDNEVDIFIDGDIVDASTQEFYKEWFGDDTTTSYKSFRSQIDDSNATTFNVYINSGGGLVTDAMAIHDLLKDLQNKGKTVNTIGRGIIASAATYILMAGNKPRMSKNSWFMIHNVSGFAWGDVDMVESYAGTLRKFNDRSRDFYSEFTGISKEDIEQMMKSETWMTAEEALAKGFIKSVDGEAEFKQSIPKDKWAFTNQTVLNAYNSAVKAENTTGNLITQKFEDMKKFFNQLATDIKNAIGKITTPTEGETINLSESIGNAISSAFESASEGFETEVNNIVNEAVKNAIDAAIKALNLESAEALNTAVQKLVTDSIAEGTKELATKEDITNLENEIANKVGNKGNTGEETPGTPAPIGNWSE